MLTGGCLPVVVGSCPRIACCKILEANSCRMMCPPGVTQGRDPIVLPRDAPARGRRARIQRPDIRRKGEGGRMHSRAERVSTRRLSTVDRRTFPRGLRPRIREGMTPHHTNPTSTSSLARISS
ncbi:hypothetical protein PIB30_096737 [Stylosanthes scabra]|uniref:Uncharacterized protein n=1 Tax=Stylosanthes scabra TaxID=79078 RepID=A0ABU6RWM8_9FABA|nr:hypothetical protein [Stylosanthes scabra]